MVKKNCERGLVWRSTPESIESGKISVLAVVEIGLALTIYLGAARAFGWWLPVLVSAVAAPLLLLRSKASTAQAMSMWERHLESRVTEKVPKYAWIAGILAILAMIFTAIWLLSSYFLIEHSTWRLIIVQIFTILIFAIILKMKRAPIQLLTVAITAATGFGTLLWTIFIRIKSILIEWRAGISALPTNWQRTMFSVDLSHPPELIPGLEKNAYSPTPQHIWQITDGKSSGNYITEYIVKFLFIIIWFAPAYLWRLALKSTFWLYGPALFIAYPGQEGRAEWVSRPLTAWERHQWWIALATLGGSVVMLTSFGTLWTALPEASEAGVPFIATWALALDWGLLFTQPWQLLSLINLVMAIGIFYWRDHLRTRVRNGEAVAMTGWPLGWLVRLAKAQLVVFVLYWMVSIWNLVFWLEGTGKI